MQEKKKKNIHVLQTCQQHSATRFFFSINCNSEVINSLCIRCFKALAGAENTYSSNNFCSFKPTFQVHDTRFGLQNLTGKVDSPVHFLSS